MYMQGGMPIPLHPERPNLYNPIHEDDLIRQIPELLDVASVPATIVNWGGDPVSIEDWCAYLGELTGLEPKFEETPHTIGSVTIDRARMHELIGPAEVEWQDGMRRMVEARFPDLLAKAPEPVNEPDTEPMVVEEPTEPEKPGDVDQASDDEPDRSD
jgi:hypothetical protein